MKYKLHPFFNDPCPPVRSCEQEGCILSGEFKAPRSRSHLRDYLWFCLDHVRAYNQRWNYYSGMNEQELEYEQRMDVTWQRPTWPFARAPSEASFIHPDNKPFFDFNAWDERRFQRQPRARQETDQSQALALMDLSFPFTRRDLKRRYIEFAKKYHPDMNGGSLETQERLKEINRAYEILKKLSLD